MNPLAAIPLSLITASFIGIVVITLVLPSTNGLQTNFSGLNHLNQVEFPALAGRTNDGGFESDIAAEAISNIQDFSLNSATALFQQQNATTVYSPTSLFLALALAAEAAQGPTFDEMISAMGIPDLTTLRSVSQSLFERNYFEQYADDQLVAKGQLNNGLFVRDDVVIESDYLAALARYYYTEAFQTTFDDQAKIGIADWMNARTYDFLEVTPNEVTVTPETVMALYNTFYLKANWLNSYDEHLNFQGTFTDAFSGQVQNDMTFMQKQASLRYYENETFTAVSEATWGSQRIVFVLPRQGMTPLDLLIDERASLEEALFSQLTPTPLLLSIPKATLKSKVNLIETLQALGVNQAFTDQADFSKAMGEIYIDAIEQKAGIEWNEDGFEAAAYTEIGFSATSTNPETYREVTLDRSFLFFIVDSLQTVNFAGIIHHI